MNAALILAGGSGRRFGSDLPKQYHMIDGRMVIEYVLDAALSAQSLQRVLVCAALPCPQLTAIQDKYRFTLVPGGDRRNETLQNGLEALSDMACQSVVVLDAVRPLVTGELLDRYITWIAQGYDAVATAQPITDSLGCYDAQTVDRSRYYLMQSPEAFNYALLRRHFDPQSPLTEVTQQLPKGSRVKLHFGFDNNIKLTYAWELDYLKSALAALKSP